MSQPAAFLGILLQGQEKQPSPFSNIMFLLLPLFLIWFFMVIRPSSKEKKLQGAMRQSLKKGDKVLTQAGIIAKVHAVHEGEIVLNLDGTAKMRVATETIIRRLEEAKGDGSQRDKNNRQATAAN